MKRIVSSLIMCICALLLWGGATTASAYTYPPSTFDGVSVRNEEEFRRALESGTDLIQLDAPIHLTAPLELNSRELIIHGNSIVAAAPMPSMLKIRGGHITFWGVTLDGNHQARAIDVRDGARLEFTESISIIQNSTSAYDPGHAEGGSIYMLNSSILFSGGEIKNSSTNVRPDNPQDSAPHGGAVYAVNSSIEMWGVDVRNNFVLGGIGHGGAFYVEGSSVLDIHGCTFEQNGFWSKRVMTGGAIYAGNGAQVRIGDFSSTPTRFNIGGFTNGQGFNTGGAIRLLGASATIDQAVFTILDDNGDAYGTAGGAIMSEGSSLNVIGSTFQFFNPGANSAKLEFAGGFISVVGQIKDFNITNSTFTGRGNANHTSTATYGGAIVFESLNSRPDYTVGNATITGTSFKDFHSDSWGGAIALSTKPGESNGVNLTIKDGTFNNCGTLFWGSQYGGAIAVGPGNTLTLDHTTIAYGKAGIGGGIYNQGDTTLTGGSRVAGCLGYNRAGGIYNDGRLVLDDVSFAGNSRGDWSTGPHHPESLQGKPEYAGVNVYAHKDVTITPKARFDGNDVRVLHGMSKILLTGALTENIPVSVSEHDKGTEPMHRHVGYVLAEGTDGYTPTADDARHLNYVSANTLQPVAAADDHTSLATWDAVLNTRNNSVVLGQRMKVVAHSNANGTDDENFAFFREPNGSRTGIQSDTVAVFAPDMTVAEAVSSQPLRYGWDLVNWYTRAVTDADVAANPNQDVVAGLTPTATEIVEPIDPSEIHAYAGWRNAASISATTVGYGNHSASADKPLSIVRPAEEINAALTLNDVVALKGLSTSQRYRLVTVVYELSNDPNNSNPKAVKVVINRELIEPTAAEMTHTVNLAFAEDELSRDTNYVIYEYLFSADQQLNTPEFGAQDIDVRDRPYILASHADAFALSQTFRITEEVITPVDVVLSARKVLEGRAFSEHEYYTFTVAPGTVTPNDITMPYPADGMSVAVNDGNKTDFTKLTFTKPGVYTYVISETAGDNAHMNYSTDQVTVTITVTKKNTALEAAVTHSNGKNEAVFTNTYPTLSTVVSAGNQSAAFIEDAWRAVQVEAGIHQVTDTINYKNLKTNESYRVKSELVKVGDSGNTVVKTVEQDVVITEANGTISVDFGEVELEGGARYVVFESLNFTSTANNAPDAPAAPWLEHKDVKDAAQTILALEPAPAPTPVPDPDPEPDPVAPTPAPDPDPTPAPDPDPDPDPTPAPMPNPDVTPDPLPTPDAPQEPTPSAEKPRAVAIPKAGDIVFGSATVGLMGLIASALAVFLRKKSQ